MGLIHFPKVLRPSLLACVSYRRKKNGENRVKLQVLID